MVFTTKFLDINNSKKEVFSLEGFYPCAEDTLVLIKETIWKVWSAPTIDLNEFIVINFVTMFTK
jgi:hypothetical protein